MAEDKNAVKVVVEIFGEKYPLRTDGDAEYLKLLAKTVDDHMKSVARRTMSFSGSKIGVMAAMEIADEYYKLKKDYDELMALLDEK